MKYLLILLFSTIIILAVWLGFGGASGKTHNINPRVETNSQPLEGSVDTELLMKLNSAYE